MLRKLIRAVRRERPITTTRKRLLVAFPWEIGFARYLWLTRFGRRESQAFDNPDVATKEIEYSRSYLTRYAPDRRVQWTMFLLASIPDCRRDSLLIIGPRYEPELLMARGLGWDPDGVRGLDTFSYSPSIDVGDMHHMEYPDQSFSAIVCAWTLSYSTEPRTAAAEIQRVLRPEGYLVVSMQKVAADFEERALPEVLSGRERVQTLECLDELFSGLNRVAGFEPDLEPGDTGHTVAAYRKPRVT